MPSPFSVSYHDFVAPDSLIQVDDPGTSGVKDTDVLLSIGELTIFISPGRLRKLHDVIGEALAEMPPARQLNAAGEIVNGSEVTTWHINQQVATLDPDLLALDENAAVKLLRGGKTLPQPCAGILDASEEVWF